MSPRSVDEIIDHWMMWYRRRRQPPPDTGWPVTYREFRLLYAVVAFFVIAVPAILGELALRKWRLRHGPEA